ncbi:plasmalemma vesicle associated protein b [Mobula birostris]|uniref:plasmalemma vesicle associated protein b n=1 Tax=Mobula birostris TaxID=1983395 RepID=UPI003B28DD18
MDHNSYPMKKLGYNTKDYNTMKPNSCSSYFRYCLLFTSLIQMLIILGLVLFMTYGNTYSSHQSHLETSQNQSVQLIREVQSQKGTIKSLMKNLTSCNYEKGNLTEQLKIMNKTMIRWILQKNYTDYFNLPFDRYFEQYFSLKRNCTDLQWKFEKCMSDQQFRERRDKLKERELEEQIRKLYQQLWDIEGNCTSMSKDFRTTLNEAKANYESSFSKLTSGRPFYSSDIRDQLDQIKANCSPVSLSFEREIQQQLSRIDREIQRVLWTNVDQQRMINTLKKGNEECKNGEAIKLDDNTKKVEKLVEANKQCLGRMIEVQQQKDDLENRLNNLRNRQQPYHYSFNRRTVPSFESSCQENVNLLQKMVDLLNDQLAAMWRKEASMDLKLKEQEARCWNWRMSEYRVKTP